MTAADLILPAPGEGSREVAVRVARTLADLDGTERVGRVRLAEALSYRALADKVRQTA